LTKLFDPDPRTNNYPVENKCRSSITASSGKIAAKILLVLWSRYYKDIMNVRIKGTANRQYQTH
jgi:hypothetical protein